MRVTVRSDYAIRALLELAAAPAAEADVAASQLPPSVRALLANPDAWVRR